MKATITSSEPCQERVRPALPVIPWAGLVLLWCAGSVGAIAIARQKHVPVSTAIPIAAAFLLELTLWACLKRMAHLRPAAWVASAVAPYLVLTLPTGLFQWWAAFLLILFATALSFWLCSLHAKWDWAFLTLLAALLLFPLFYPEVLNLKTPALGKLMWLVQPEVEKGRSPLASIPPFGRGFSRHPGLPIRCGSFEERRSEASALRSSSR